MTGANDLVIPFYEACVVDMFRPNFKKMLRSTLSVEFDLCSC